VELRFLYIGSANTERDLATWLALPRARLRWRFGAYGADVAAVDLGTPPLVLIADHRPPGSVLPIYAVSDIDETVEALIERGWARRAGPLGTPEGPAVVLHDGSDTAMALLRVDRPGAMDDAYGDPTNSHWRPAPKGQLITRRWRERREQAHRTGAATYGAPIRGWLPRWAVHRFPPPR